jgi:hypothetical protein
MSASAAATFAVNALVDVSSHSLSAAGHRQRRLSGFGLRVVQLAGSWRKGFHTGRPITHVDQLCSRPYMHELIVVQ